MLGFLRRRSAHARGGLGAAVTAIPSAPVPAPPSFLPAPAAAVPAVEADLPVVPAQQEEPTGVRVELGFRDGTSACLDPASVEAQALDALAQLLTRRP